MLPQITFFLVHRCRVGVKPDAADRHNTFELFTLHGGRERNLGIGKRYSLEQGIPVFAANQAVGAQNRQQHQQQHTKTQAQTLPYAVTKMNHI